MAFGQSPGPPATARQMQDLTALIEQAGHSDFRDARGPLGLNQRQAGGRFTRDEADELIGRLQGESDGSEPVAPVVAVAPADRREAERARVLAKIPDQVLAAELQRRGWVVMEP